MNAGRVRRPAALAVVVPAHNEARELPAALRALRAAARHPALAGLPVVTVVAADACTDATPTVAARLGAAVVELPGRNVGAARAAGVDHALRLLGPGADRAWIATTDADTLVPPHWLAHHAHRARQGWHCVVGTVRLRRSPSLPERARALHDSHYFAGRPGAPHPWAHPHVHGANLGVAARRYRAAGGFPALAHGEDRALVAALEEHGCRILRTDECPVRTSARLDSRAPHGFGAFLQNLALPMEAAAPAAPAGGSPAGLRTETGRK
ncbi:MULTISPECIES: glycosyltransferase [Streptomyces]|uniref:glycosyltransferase n=1 Tax=Streptomyces TaxID=1883 RepID=UPI000A04910F|nr:glycosyltransferase [Streptomyces sp. MOE7]